MKPLCIYHGNCQDGFTAAWVVRKFFGADGVEFHAGVYQDPPPDVRERDVILVDFSYKRGVLLQMAQHAKSILVLDHHKSAAEDLRADKNQVVDFGTYSGGLSWQRLQDNVAQDAMEGCPYARVYVVFDMARSGAGVAWDFFFPGMPRPQLISHVEDRDLWRFALADTREISANIFSRVYDFTLWDEMVSLLSLPGGTNMFAAEGRAIERKHHKDVAELVGVTRRDMILGGHRVPVANLPYTLTSDAGHLMCGEGAPFAACYWDTPQGRVFSLRSRDGGADVSAIAKLYGGGGHKNAAGFRMPIGWEGDGAPAAQS